MARKKKETYALPACLVRGQLDQASQDLREFIDARPEVKVDAGNVIEIDAPGLQLLIAASLYAHEQGKSFAMTEVSDPVREGARSNRVEGALGL